MSKAEDFAYSKYPKDRKGILYDLARNSILQGYEQAEKDNELTWEDIWKLDIILAEVDVDIEFNKIDIETGTIGYYKEVLNRFNKQKGKNI